MKTFHNTVHLWHGRVPIRLRLTLWYLLSFSVIILVFSAFLENRITSGLENQADSALRLAANRTLTYVVPKDGALVLQDAEALADMSNEFSVYLLAPDRQTVWSHLGLEDIPVFEAPDENTAFTILDRGPQAWDNDQYKDLRVYQRAVLAEDGTVIGWLQIAQDLDRRHTLGMLRGHMCLAMPFGLLMAGLGGIWLASRALRPIDQVTRTAQTINTTDLHQRLNYVGPNDEVGRLALTFDGMLDRLQAGFERERRFTGDAAHELRTPLTALKGHIGVTLSQPRSPDEYAETLGDLEQQVDRLIRLSNDLLFMARLDYYQQRKSSELIGLSELLAALQDQVMPLVEAKSQALESHVEPDLSVQGNIDLLIRLFLNLLDNAIKYTPPGGRISLYAQQNGGEIHITLTDNGPGIPADQLPHLFERFYRVERNRTRRHDAQQSGAGLGLAIAQEIAHVHGGQITVRSELGRGSTFTVRLPR